MATSLFSYPYNREKYMYLQCEVGGIRQKVSKTEEISYEANATKTQKSIGLLALKFGELCRVESHLFL